MNLNIKVLHIAREAFPAAGGYVIRTENIICRLRTYINTLDIAGGIFSRNSTCLKNGNNFVKEDIHYYQMLTKPILVLMNFVEKLPKIRLLFHYLYILLNTILILLKTRPKNYEIIHGHSYLKNGFSALLVSKIFGKKFIYDVHGLHIDNFKTKGLIYRIDRRITGNILRNSDAIIVIDYLLSGQIQNDFGISKEKIFIAPNGVDSNFFKPTSNNTELRKKLLINDQKFIIGVDNSKYVENFDFVVDNLNEMKKIIPNLQVIVFGSRRVIQDETILMKENIPFEEMPKYYGLLDLFIMPRLRNRQTETITPLKLLEAMSCEVLVLASDVGGITACITHKVTGLIFDLNKSEDFIKNLQYAYLNDTRRLRTNARKWVHSNRNWQDAVAAYNNAYEYVLRQ